MRRCGTATSGGTEAALGSVLGQEDYDARHFFCRAVPEEG
jgi:hypothetical protein